MIVRTVVLGFQFGFAVICSFACSFGNGNPAWQKDFEILRRLRSSKNGGVFIRIIRDVGFHVGSRGALTASSCWSVSRMCHRVRNCCYRSYGPQANSPAKKSRASKTAEKLRPEEIA